MKKMLLMCGVAAVVLSCVDLTSAQTSQIDRMRAEQQSRTNQMQSYVDRMKAQQNASGVQGNQSAAIFERRNAESNAQPATYSRTTSSSSSSSGGFRVRRSRGMGKLIGLVVVGVFALGGFILRLITGDTD